MLIAVISDLHLGAGGPDDPFGHDDHEFLRFLTFLEHEFESIVLLGDIWETLGGSGFGDAVRQLRRARAAHREIADRLRRPRFRHVHGNHDLVTARTDGAPDHLLLEADGTRLLLTHGHQYDWRHRTARALLEVAVWLGGWLRRHGFAPLYRWAEQVEMDWSSLGTAVPQSDFQRQAVADARDQGADVVVTGHTHVLARGDHGERVFLNSGACKDGRFGFLALDTRRGVLGLHDGW